MSNITEIKTDDLAMATFLNMEGFPHERLEMKDRRSAVWIFNGDGELEACVDCYQGAEARVEPLAFSQRLRAVRDELYQFLKANRPSH